MFSPSKAGRAWWVGGAALSILTACGAESPSVLDPQGPAAREVTRLWWPMLFVATAVLLFVIVMGAIGIWRGRHRREEALARDVPWGDRFILISGLGVTALILVGFFVFSLRSMSTLASNDPLTGLQIRVIGHDWWWEARYPNGGITANEIHIPAGQRVRFRLQSADVIHSLWVPQLAPKIDLIPGRETHLWLRADRPGRYRGQCAEYCGLQHARMAFYIVADPPNVFRGWLRGIGQRANRPTGSLEAQGLQVFLTNTCAGCHAIRGTPADARLGPDLTHFATRETFAAATLELTAENLRRWILDPDSIKPGTTMPPSPLSQRDIRTLVAYLLSLGFGSNG